MQVYALRGQEVFKQGIGADSRPHGYLRGSSARGVLGYHGVKERGEQQPGKGTRHGGQKEAGEAIRRDGALL